MTDSTDDQTCTVCGLSKPPDGFGKRGAKYPCHSCREERTRDSKRRYAETNRERIRKRMREHAAIKRAENPEVSRAKNRAFYAADPARGRAYVAKYNATHATERTERNRRYNASHPEVLQASFDKVQNQSLENATRGGQVWAGWEMELAGDKSRKAKDVAKTLGRTYAAVRGMRQRIQRDPATITRAGLSESGRV